MNRSSNGFGLFGIFVAVVVMVLVAAVTASPEANRAGGNVAVVAK